MSYEVWNGPNDKVTIANGGTTSGQFSMPDRALGVIFFIPQLTAATSLKVQAIKPKDSDVESDTAADLSTILTGAGAVTASTVSGLGSGSAATAYGFDAGVLGAGTFQLVANGAQSSGAVTITIHWRTDRQRH